jgi:hypothetical protein
MTESTKQNDAEIFASAFIKLENAARYARELNELRDEWEAEAPLAYVAFVKAMEPHLTEVAKLEGKSGLRIIKGPDLVFSVFWLPPVIPGELRIEHYDPIERTELRGVEAERELARHVRGSAMGHAVNELYESVTANCNYSILHEERVNLDAIRTLRENAEATLAKRAARVPCKVALCTEAAE